MLRLSLLWFFVLGLSVYAWRDWYKALCGLILLMAVLEHPDMPKSVFGVQGLNPWNLLFVSVVLAWISSRRREALRWDMPPHITWLLVAYLGVVLVGVVRLLEDPQDLDATTSTMISEFLMNAVKWVIPGLLLFDGCRSRSRLTMGLACLLVVYVLLGVQVIRWMPAGAILSGSELNKMSAKLLLNEIGYHKVNLSMMLAGAFWAIWATRALATRRSLALLIVAVSLLVAYAQALTAGRMGYLTWGGVGLVLCLVRWRRYLPLVPLVVMLITWAIPAAEERMLQGFSRGDVAEERDEYQITSGRNIAWPYITDKIGESPMFGFGRQAMVTTGLTGRLWEEFGEEFPHPHNAYLEWLLDNGYVGLLPIVAFYLVVLAHGLSLFRDSRSPVFIAVGGAVSSLVLALLLASIGSQTFYPREGAVGMWCAIGLALRVWVERARADATARERAREASRKRISARAFGPGGRALSPAGVAAVPREPDREVPSTPSIDGLLWRRAT